MREGQIDPAGDVLTCSKCDGKAMFIYIEENQVQRAKCASCGDLVAYTSELIRLLGKREDRNG
jgi:Zn ribbon nucleic-acid-binding protein